VRTLAFAQMLISEYELVFVCRYVPSSYINEISNIGFGLILIDVEDDFFRYLTIDCIVVMDGYSFDFDYQRKVKSLVQKLIFIDDLHQMKYSADLIINHAPGVKISDYNALNSTEYALGLNYVLLRPAFLKQAQQKREIKEIQSVMICFGGGDYKNLTLTTLKAIIPFGQFTEINVVTGAVYEQSQSLQSLILNDKRIKHFHSLNECEMLSIMVKSDLAIVPSSGILLEALASGAIVISGMYAENQRIFYEKFLQSGAFLNAYNFAANNISKVVRKALNNFSKTKKLIDGESSIRILRKVIALSITIRNVNAADCNLLFKWANDSIVRMNAINTEPINWDRHISWFNNILYDEKSKIFILERNGKPIGQVRFDLKGDYYIIDYSLDKESRGKGLGKIILKMAIERIGRVKIKAFVKSNNVNSIAVFRSLDFLEGENIIEKNIEYNFFYFYPN